MPKRGFCAWGTLFPKECVAVDRVGQKGERKPLSELLGNRRDNRARKRPKMALTGCKLCNVNLYVKFSCF